MLGKLHVLGGTVIYHCHLSVQQVTSSQITLLRERNFAMINLAKGIFGIFNKTQPTENKVLGVIIGDSCIAHFISFNLYLIYLTFTYVIFCQTKYFETSFLNYQVLMIQLYCKYFTYQFNLSKSKSIMFVLRKLDSDIYSLTF